jgi:L-ascorbate metabolism protein UlaG (beta-lactamase superfamily)
VVTITHVGGPTALLELEGWRLLTDPTFDPAGRRYAFGWGTSSVKTRGPAVPADSCGDLDAVLVSHDQHADNLDEHGRGLLPTASNVVTTVRGARRLGLPGVRGLSAGQSVALDSPGKPTLTVTATPARHGPPLSTPLVGPVIGFLLRVGTPPTTVWVTGDTVLHRRLRRTAAAWDVDVMVVHLGQVGFPITGPSRFSMNAAAAARLIAEVGPRVVVPVHYEGWSHFREPTSHARHVLSTSGAAGVVRWLEPGEATVL